MNIIEEKFDDVIVAIVNLDRATLKDAHELKDFIEKKIQNDQLKVIVDLTACEFIDSTFLGSLVGGLKKLLNKGGDLKLVGFKPAVRSMFELTRMFRVFETFDDLQTAVNSYNK